YTPWVTRVVAFFVDYFPYAIIIGIGWLVLLGTEQTACVTDISRYAVDQVCASGYSMFGVTTFWLAQLVGLAYVVWNYGYRQGTTGSSIGKSLMKFKVVSENNGQPIGFGMSVVRQLAHLVDSIICYIGYLFPLWDAKRQTLADKIMSTVCLPVE
ncbi:RDD family protein, partial [uncultured Mycobacterium sp.]|uniref:RDD family protein n=1 Tax=uncultured Mycobacterium sp. TaxID=171292 RepID=UPI0035CC33C4